MNISPRVNPNFKARFLSTRRKSHIANSRYSMYLGIVAALVFFLIRPSRLGLDWSLPGTIAFLGIGALCYYLSSRRSVLLNGFMVSGGVIAFWLFISGFSIAMGASTDTPIKALFLMIMSSIGATLLFSNIKASEYFYRALILWVCFSGYSVLVTDLLVIVGISPAEMKLFHIPVKASDFYNQDGAGDVLFPFSMTYSYVSWLHFVLPRTTFGFREAGIAQAIAGWALSSIPFRKERTSPLIIVGLALALILAMSATFVLTAAVVFVIWLIYYKWPRWIKIGVLVGGLAMAPLIFQWWLTDTTVGYASKAGTVSETDRTLAIERSKEEFSHHPFGVGYSNSKVDTDINLISSASSLGIEGIAFFASLLIFAHLVRVRAGGTLIPMLPILATALTTQPLFDAGGIYIMMFIIYRDRDVTSNGTPKPLQRPKINPRLTTKRRRSVF